MPVAVYFVANCIYEGLLLTWILHKFSDKKPGTKQVTAPELADSTVDLEVPEKNASKKDIRNSCKRTRTRD
jgi:hypothetical protein